MRQRQPAIDRSGRGDHFIAAVLSIVLVAAHIVPPYTPAFAQDAPGATVQPVLPAAPGSVGAIRRNAQGQIERVPQRDERAPGDADGLPATGNVPNRPTNNAAAPAEVVPTVLPASTCPVGTILCLRLASTKDAAQAHVPITFGHAFAPGLVPAGLELAALLNNATIPVQMDQIATHRDGSVRFAILSLVLPAVGKQQTAELRIVAATGTPQAAGSIGSVQVGSRIEIETFAAQLTEVIVGNKDSGTPLVPFKRGETVSLVINGETSEQFALTVTPDMERQDYQGFQRIAEAFVVLVSKSRTYRAHRDVPEAYERFWITTRTRSCKPFTIRFVYGGNAKFSHVTIQECEAPQRFAATLPSRVGESDKAIRGAKWLDGPLAREVIYNVPFLREGDGKPHPQLSARYGVRRYAGTDATRVEVVVENTASFVDLARNWSYDAEVFINQASMFQLRDLTHYHHARWRKLFWVGEAPQVSLIHDRLRMLDSRAIPFYDPQLRAPDATIVDQWRGLQKADTGPMGPAFITPYMWMTGMRSDIGPLPRWSALHAISPDPRLLAVVLANGDASGSVPMHYRDQSSGLPLNIKQHPQALIPGTFSTGEGMVTKLGWAHTPFTLDTAHQPSLAYYPYLLTGDLYYLEELQFWASWNVLIKRSSDRGGANGLLYVDQVRGQAWALRTLGHAALITPDSHPLKAAFNEQLRANIAWYLAKYAVPSRDGPNAPAGWIEEGFPSPEMSPWVQDFMAIVLAYLSENDVEGARQLVKSLARFVLARWLSESAGFCRMSAASYRLILVDPQTSRPFRSWAEVSRQNWPNQKSCPTSPPEGSYPACAGCILSQARAALAALISLGYEAGREPFDLIRTSTENRMASFAQDPTFALAPRVALFVR